MKPDLSNSDSCLPLGFRLCRKAGRIYHSGPVIDLALKIIFGFILQMDRFLLCPDLPNRPLWDGWGFIKFYFCSSFLRFLKRIRKMIRPTTRSTPAIVP